MNKQLIINAILSAINLLSGEMESLCDENLLFEYKETLNKLELALNEVENRVNG